MTAVASRGILVAGIGNVFRSDDGFGVEVARRMAALPPAPGVRVEDYGIRGVHLAYELLEGYEGLVLLDAVPMGEAPGTVAVIEAEPDGADAPLLDAHVMSPEVVLATLAHLGGEVGRIYVLGCQPASLDEGMGLSRPVAAAVEGAVELCQQLVQEMSAASLTNRGGKHQ